MEMLTLASFPEVPSFGNHLAVCSMIELFIGGHEDLRAWTMGPIRHVTKEKVYSRLEY
jgi:hypothetical protein